MQPIVDIYGGGYSGGGARSGPGYLLHQPGGQKDGSCCSADGNDYAYVEDLVYPPPATTTTMTATGPPASSFGHLNHPQTVITAASATGVAPRRDVTSPAGAGLRIMHHML